MEEIRAAVEARRDPDFIIKARTDATATHSVKKAIRRLLTRDNIALVAREVPKPLAVNMGFGIRSRPTTPSLSARELQYLGVAWWAIRGW